MAIPNPGTEMEEKTLINSETSALLLQVCI